VFEQTNFTAETVTEVGQRVSQKHTLRKAHIKESSLIVQKLLNV